MILIKTFPINFVSHFPSMSYCWMTNHPNGLDGLTLKVLFFGKSFLRAIREFNIPTHLPESIMKVTHNKLKVVEKRESLKKI